MASTTSWSPPASCRARRPFRASTIRRSRRYVEIVEGRRTAGARVAIIGAGGIGFDVAEFLTAGTAPDGHASEGARDDPAIVAFRDEWGIDPTFAHRGGLKPAHDTPPPRQVWLLQRKEAKVGAALAKTTGWIRRTLLKRRGVAMIAGVEYERIDDAGLHIKVDGVPKVLAVDTIVVCAGQEPRRDIVAGLDRSRHPPPAHRRRGCRGGTRRAARDRAGDEGRAGAVGSVRKRRPSGRWMTRSRRCAFYGRRFNFEVRRPPWGA